MEATDARLFFDQKKTKIICRLGATRKSLARAACGGKHKTRVWRCETMTISLDYSRTPRRERERVSARERERELLQQRPLSRAGAPPALADAGMFVLDV